MKQAELRRSDRVRNTSRTLLLALVIIAGAGLPMGCERRPLVDDIYFTAKIPIRAYWDKAALDIPASAPHDVQWSVYNATILVYNDQGTLYLEKAFTSRADYAETEITLDEGRYTLFVFNEKRDQIDNVHIRGYEQLSTLEAYVSPAATVYTTQSRAAGETMVAAPGHLAVARYELNVTRELITRTRSNPSTRADASTPATRAADEALGRLIDLHPVRKTSVVTAIARIKGLNNARMPALVELRHMAEGYHFATDRNTLVPVSQQFFMNNRRYNAGSTTDGTINQILTSFGVPGDRLSVSDLPSPLMMDFNFILVDKEKTPIYQTFDITHMIRFRGTASSHIDIDLDIDINNLPDVKPEGGSGMEAVLHPWQGEDIGLELGGSKKQDSQSPLP